MDSVADLQVLLDSRYPLLFVETTEEPRFLALLRDITNRLDTTLWLWSATRGLARDGQEYMYRTADPNQALAFIEEIQTPAAFVFADAQPILRDDIVVRRLKEVAQQATPGQTLIITGPTAEVPAALANVAHVWRLKPPSRTEIATLVEKTLRHATQTGVHVAVSADETARIVDTLTGLTLAESERLLQQAISDDGVVNADDLTRIRAAKASMFVAEGLLELIEPKVSGFGDVGGMTGIKDWLRIRERATTADARRYGIEPPKGILLTGVPGCGKSLIAKAIAAQWDFPLIMFDPSRLYGKYIGESEERLGRALESVDAMSPVVLWIDEIEKGFASGGEDGGVSNRLLGTFLRWMQDRIPGVFLVATANNVRSLPPEFLRKGRFDEIFFVDLPGAADRSRILDLHLSIRGWDPTSFDLLPLVESSAGFSGAELEAAVVGALYRAFDAGENLTTADLIEEINTTVPLSRSRHDDIATLRSWASTRTVPA